MFSYLDPTDLSQVGFYTTHDTRPGFLERPRPDHARRSSRTRPPRPTSSTSPSAPSRPTSSTTSTSSSPTATRRQLLAALQADPLLSQDPGRRARRGRRCWPTPPRSAAAANPSPLSIPWGLDDYLALLAAAADKAGVTATATAHVAAGVAAVRRPARGAALWLARRPSRSLVAASARLGRLRRPRVVGWRDIVAALGGDADEHRAGRGRASAIPRTAARPAGRRRARARPARSCRA